MTDKPRILGPDGVSTFEPDAKLTAGEAMQLATDFNLVTGRGTVKLRIPGTDTAYVMLPAEARILGMRLVCEAEKAVDDAVFLRAAIEIFEMSPADAVTLLKTLGKATRADHAFVYEKMLKAAAEHKAMGATDGTPSTPN